jgi:hypothetical protein
VGFYLDLGSLVVLPPAIIIWNKDAYLPGVHNGKIREKVTAKFIKYLIING